MTSAEGPLPGTAAPAHAWRRLLAHVGNRAGDWLRGLLLILALLIAALLALAWLNSPPWPYSLVADTEYVMLKPASTVDTQWSVEGATICRLRDNGQHADAGGNASASCGSPRWIEVPADPVAEPSLVLVAAAADYTARFSLAESGGLALHVSARGDEGALVLVGSDGSRLALGTEALMRFAPTAAGEWPRRLVFPFTGNAFIGDDARASGAAILREGTLAIHAQADDTVSGRTVIDEIVLVPGDRVELATAQGAGAHPRGFIHADLLAPKPDMRMTGMQVVAFGQSEALRIVRFGEQGLTFKPGLWARLTRHPLVNSWVALLMAAFGLVLTVIPLCADRSAAGIEPKRAAESSSA